jgi:hypothetical protein
MYDLIRKDDEKGQIILIGMDLNTISNFAVAIGTLALAFIALLNIINSDKQLKFLKKQTDFFLSQQQPDIQIKKYSFDGNNLNLTLFNKGDGDARYIRVSCNFHITAPYILARGQYTTPKIFEPRMKEYLLKPDDEENIPSNLKRGDKILLNPGELVVFPNNVEFSNSLPAGREGGFQCEPHFYLKTKKVLFGKSPNYSSKGITFDKLRPLLLENKIEQISVIFNLLSKDKLQNVKSHGVITNFVIILSEDETLETAYKRGKRGSYNMDINEIQSKIKWEDYDGYLYGKYLDPDDELFKRKR